MKIVELLNHLQMPITNEQSDLLGRFTEEPIISKKDLSDREQLVANQLTEKDVLLRLKENGQIIYKKKIR